MEDPEIEERGESAKRPEQQVIHLPRLEVNIAPFAFQHWARDFYSASKTHGNTSPFSPARFFLLTRSIELAAKSLHLKHGADVTQLRAIGHDLVKACCAELMSAFDIRISGAEQSALDAANNYYKHKGFEYFLFSNPSLGVAEETSGPQLAMTGYPNLPDERALEMLLEKLLSQKVD